MEKEPYIDRLKVFLESSLKNWQKKVEIMEMAAKRTRSLANKNNTN